jgi:hypothetical protein
MSSYLVNPLVAPSLNPFSMAGGNLDIAAFSAPAGIDPDALGDKPNVSGMLTTYSSFAQQYGYFEVRAELPSTPGVMSAFWLLPADGSWPPEVDVFEIPGVNPTSMLMTVHSQDYSIPTLATVANTSTGFHDFAVDWEPDTITWYFDGTQVAQAATPPDLNQPMYMLLDTMTGVPGSRDGQPTGSFSDAMQVQWVHVFASNPYPDTAATVGADKIIGDAAGGMEFIYDGPNHTSSISDFDPWLDQLLLVGTSVPDFAHLSITKAADGHAIIETAGNVINLYGVIPSVLNAANVLFAVKDPTT